ncbi:MAG: winged helix-turn-helix transcriptional regulator [Trueperaceae bacterium]|nr:metalloregulator ArsR/SmtB family transcription factor [Anaerolineae bacterium]UCH26118.1 MAG: winged helix-turn-helix transcriptional regulator [Trueperaceae bacterium]
MNHHPFELPPHHDDLTAAMETFKALADETRLKLIAHLYQGEHRVNDLVEALVSPQSTVSRHLAVLRHAKLVVVRRDGTSAYYRLADAHVGHLVTQAFAHAQHKRLGLPDHEDETQEEMSASRDTDAGWTS